MNPFKSVARLFGSKPEERIMDAHDLTFAALLGMQTSSKAGVVVDVDKALRVSTVLGCCRVLAEDVAKLPFRMKRSLPGGRKEIAKDHPLDWILHHRPNAWMTSFEFRETLMFHALLAQGGYAWISRSFDGRILEMIPLLPGAVTIRPFNQTREVVFDVSDQKGIIGTFPRKDILHIRGPSWDTARGLAMVQQAREAIGLGIAIEESQERLHANGARPSGVITTEKSLGVEGRKRLKELFEEGFTSLINAGKVPVLDNGLKFVASAMTSIDAETLASRKFQIEEICRIFRVYPQKIMHTEKTSTYASAEQFNIHHSIDSIHPWVDRWEQSVARDCLSEEEIRAGYEPSIDMRELLRGDSVARSTYIKNGVMDGWLTRNEAREIEGLDPIDGLDVPLMPLNMTDGTKPPAPKPAPVSPAAPGASGDESPSDSPGPDMMGGA